MSGIAAISLATGLEDAEKVTVALLMAIGAAEQGRPTTTFLTKEAVRLALDGFVAGVACDGCPPPPISSPATPPPAARSSCARCASTSSTSTSRR